MDNTPKDPHEEPIREFAVSTDDAFRTSAPLGAAPDDTAADDLFEEAAVSETETEPVTAEENTSAEETPAEVSAEPAAEEASEAEPVPEDSAKETPEAEQDAEDTTEESYHQISLAEDSPDLFGEEASVAAAALEEASAAEAEVRRPTEAEEKLEELLQKQKSSRKAASENAEWKNLHREFAEEVEHFAEEAETFAQKVSRYISDSEQSFARYEAEYGEKIRNEEPFSDPKPERKLSFPARKKKEKEKTSVLEYKDVEAEDLPVRADKAEKKPEKKPEERKTRKQERLEAEKKISADSRTDPRPAIPWRRTPADPVLVTNVVGARFEIPTGTPEELREMPDETAVARRSRPKYSFNDEQTRDLSPLEEIHLEARSLEDYLGVELPDENAYPASEDPLSEEPENFTVPDVKIPGYVEHAETVDSATRPLKDVAAAIAGIENKAEEAPIHAAETAAEAVIDTAAHVAEKAADMTFRAPEETAVFEPVQEESTETSEPEDLFETAETEVPETEAAASETEEASEFTHYDASAETEDAVSAEKNPESFGKRVGAWFRKVDDFLSGVDPNEDINDYDDIPEAEGVVTDDASEETEEILEPADPEEIAEETAENDEVSAEDSEEEIVSESGIANPAESAATRSFQGWEGREDTEDEELSEESSSENTEEEQPEKVSFMDRVRGWFRRNDSEDSDADEADYAEEPVLTPEDEAEEAPAEEPAAEPEAETEDPFEAADADLTSEEEIPEEEESVSEETDPIEEEAASESNLAAVAAEMIGTPSLTEEVGEADEDETEKRYAMAQKTVGLPPIHNERIAHEILNGKIDLDEEDEDEADVEEYANAFATQVFRPVSADNVPQEATSEQTTMGLDEVARLLAEQEKAEERKNRPSNFRTGELEEMPESILPHTAKLNKLDKTILAQGGTTMIHTPSEELEGQIQMDGFTAADNAPEQMDEDHVEKELQERRDRKVKDFKLQTEDLDEDVYEGEPEEGEIPHFAARADVSDYLNDEYRNSDDRRRISRKLEKASRQGFIGTILQAVLTVVALVFGILVAAGHGNLDAVGGNATVCGILNLIVLALSAGFGWMFLKKGVKGIVQGKINASSGVAVVYVVALIETFVLMFVETSSEAASLYTASACFTMLLCTWGRYLSLKRADDNFKFLSSGSKLYRTRVVESGEDARKIGKGISEHEPTIAYHTDAEIPAGFVAESFADDPADKNAKRPFFVTVAVAALAGLIFGIVMKNVATGINLFAALCAIGIPSFTIMTYQIGLYLQDKEFSRHNAAILGHRAVEKSTYVDTYALDSNELFGKGACAIGGIKTFNGMKIDDAILTAAALVVPSDGPLADVFERTILGKDELLPEAEDLIYEERLGLSAWIGTTKRVLFGTRTFLQHHNVELPSEEFEEEYKRGNRQICYLAVSGKVAAMFVLQYRASRRIRQGLRQLTRSGVKILVRNNDCNITEDLISKKYRIPADSVKIISPTSGELLQEYKDGKKESVSDDLGILHSGSLSASMRSLYEARKLQAGISINAVFAQVYTVAALLFGIISAAVSDGGPGTLSDPKVFLFQVICALLVVGTSALRGRPKTNKKKKK